MPDKVSEYVLQQLRTAAMSALENAYAPYSLYPVAAALLTTQGKIVQGCNIENAAYPSGLCAEASAIAQLVSSSGYQRIRAVYVLCAADEPAWPCGSCRQRLNEFADPELEVYAATQNGILQRADFIDLFPHSFGPANLRGGEK
ncbi:cytidine deaminase [Acidithiobacillus caldus]|uniref:cytidine deaminase n=1 Tax=Acidithiobacillus caldus TaxID=33059 RepID=UPI0007D9BA22|nr:cytidine deaminase [Acidithiobacillus caldus]